MVKKISPIILILLLAFVIRAAALTSFPPGLTHDEANHGREALGILEGVFLFYFPLNYGSEPLYSYTVAASMLLFGKSLFALRFVNVLFGVAAIGLTYGWVSSLFERRMGWLTAVSMAVSFWPLASSREALRAGMLPFFMVGAVWFFWKIIQWGKAYYFDDSTELSKKLIETHAKPRRRNEKAAWRYVAGFGVCVATTLHIYLAARVAWLLFPLFLTYLIIVDRPLLRVVWVKVVAGLALAGALVTPMFVYLARYPYALTRLDMLDGTLQKLKDGDFAPILSNMGRALLAFVWPGYGDGFLAYNIPGRPLFDGLTAVFFVVGILTAVYYWKRPSYAFVLLWFGVGIIPSLITGPTANTTRNLAALPAIYILPVIGFLTLFDYLSKQFKRPPHLMFAGLATAWLLVAGGISLRDYFGRWNNDVAVRGAYQHTLIEEIGYVQTQELNGTVVYSSVYPGPAHDPSIGLVMMGGQSNNSRWVDARSALLIPHDEENVSMMIPASTPPHPAFTEWLTAVDTISLRHDDLDPEFRRYELDETAVSTFISQPPIANFDNAIHLFHAQWLNKTAVPGNLAELMTVWVVVDPSRVGPTAPPAFTTDVVMFTHVLAEDGTPLTQRDALDAPSWDWQSGDIIVQIHTMLIPPETAAGTYEAVVGMYDRTSEQRRSVVDESGAIINSVAPVPPLQISDP